MIVFRAEKHHKRAMGKSIPVCCYNGVFPNKVAASISNTDKDISALGIIFNIHISFDVNIVIKDELPP